MIIAYNLNSHFLKDLGSFRKLYLKLKLWVVKLLKLNIEKTWFDYQDTRCWSLAIQYELPNLLPGPNLQFRFMKNSVYTSLLGSLRSSNIFSCLWEYHRLFFYFQTGCSQRLFCVCFDSGELDVSNWAHIWTKRPVFLEFMYELWLWNRKD